MCWRARGTLSHGGSGVASLHTIIATKGEDAWAMAVLYLQNALCVFLSGQQRCAKQNSTFWTYGCSAGRLMPNEATNMAACCASVVDRYDGQRADMQLCKIHYCAIRHCELGNPTCSTAWSVGWSFRSRFSTAPKGVDRHHRTLCSCVRRPCST